MCWKAETLLCWQRLWELGCKFGRTPKNWCLWTVVLEKTPESPLYCKEIKPVNLRGDQPWMFTGRTDAEAEAPVFWSSDARSRLIGKVLHVGKDWGQKEKRASEDETAGWHCQCNGRELGQNLGDGEGQGGWSAAVPGVTKSQTWLADWTTISYIFRYSCFYHIQKRLLVRCTFSSVRLLSCVQLFETPWTAVCQASLSITNSPSILKLMSI